MTTIHDVSFLRFPESFAKKIIAVQHRRLARDFDSAMFFVILSLQKKKKILWSFIMSKRNDCRGIFRIMIIAIDGYAKRMSKTASASEDMPMRYSYAYIKKKKRTKFSHLSSQPATV